MILFSPEELNRLNESTRLDEPEISKTLVLGVNRQSRHCGSLKPEERSTYTFTNDTRAFQARMKNTAAPDFGCCKPSRMRWGTTISA